MIFLCSCFWILLCVHYSSSFRRDRSKNTSCIFLYLCTSKKFTTKSEPSPFILLWRITVIIIRQVLRHLPHSGVEIKLLHWLCPLIWLKIWRHHNVPSLSLWLRLSLRSPPRHTVTGYTLLCHTETSPSDLRTGSKELNKRCEEHLCSLSDWRSPALSASSSSSSAWRELLIAGSLSSLPTLQRFPCQIGVRRYHAIALLTLH